MNRSSWLGFSTIVVLGFVSSGARADGSEVDAIRVVLVGGGPLTGSVWTEQTSPPGTTRTEEPTDAAGIVGAQIEFPMLRYVSLVGRLSADRYHYTEANRHHRTFLDLGIAPTVTFAIDLGRLRLEPRLGVPVGMTLHVANAAENAGLDALGLTRSSLGWHVGVLGGAYFGAADAPGVAGRIGGFLEVGYLHHRAYDSSDRVDTSYELRVHQLVIQMGLGLTL